jgi:LAO/AO transport system kinase
MVPEAGDEVQTMKAGLMEIADIFVVNKSDRPDADSFVRNLRLMLAPAFQRSQQHIPVLKTVASQKTGITELYDAIMQHQQEPGSDKKGWLFAERAYRLILESRMKDIDKAVLKKDWEASDDKNLYRFVRKYS